jgi:hypothetical protein
VQARLESNLKARHTRATDRASSLLTGFIEDAAGNRLTPSFTINHGRRYRYYVSQAVVQNPGQKQDGVARFPAHEVETRVVERIVRFLNSDADLFDQMGAEGLTPARLREQATGAKKLAAKLSSLPLAELGDLLLQFLHCVVVGEEQILVTMSRQKLRELLKNGAKTITDNLSGKGNPVDSSELISLSIEAQMKRYGGVVHVIVAPNPTTAPTSKTKPSLLKALARANAWYELVLEGKALDQRALARKAGMTERYVGKVFPCAFLAPDIVESILEGQQPDDLTFAKLSGGIPLSWADQRRQFGFPSIPSR